MLNLPAVFAGIAVRVAAAVGAPFHAGQVISIGEPVRDSGGTITAPGEAIARDCKVQIDLSGERIRGSEGYADGDATFIILAGTLQGDIDTDATVKVIEGPHAGRWMVSIIERDPAAIGYVGRGRRA